MIDNIQLRHNLDKIKDISNKRITEAIIRRESARLLVDTAVNQDIQNMANIAQKLAEEEIERRMADVNMSEMMVLMHERIAVDIDALKRAIQSIGITNLEILNEVNNIKSTNEKREEILGYIDEMVESAKKIDEFNAEEREKWR